MHVYIQLEHILQLTEFLIPKPIVVLLCVPFVFFLCSVFILYATTIHVHLFVCRVYECIIIVVNIDTCTWCVCIVGQSEGV